MIGLLRGEISASSSTGLKPENKDKKARHLMRISILLLLLLGCSAGVNDTDPVQRDETAEELIDDKLNSSQQTVDGSTESSAVTDIVHEFVPPTPLELSQFGLQAARVGVRPMDGGGFIL
ncbi:MAG: hypothetical protein R3C18_23685 [Planctomycetaceae bacterium]